MPNYFSMVKILVMAFFFSPHCRNIINIFNEIENTHEVGEVATEDMKAPLMEFHSRQVTEARIVLHGAL